jgi:hypothetical protein
MQEGPRGPFVLVVLLAAFLFLPLVGPASAQSRFETGYVLTTDGERLDGEIDDRQWITSPTSIRFRHDGDVRTISASQIQEFGVDGQVFRRYTVEGEFAESRTAEDSQPRFRRLDGLFAVLVEGPLTLLHFRDRGDFFFVEDEGNLIELRRERINAFHHGRNVTQIVDAFRHELSDRVLDCPAALARIRRLDLERFDLQYFGLFYNACVTGGDLRDLPGDRRRIRLGVAGMSTTQTSFESTLLHAPSNNRFQYNVPADQSISLGIVGLIELPGSHHQRAIELRARVTRSTYEASINRPLSFCRTDMPEVGCANGFAPGIHSLFLYGTRMSQVDLGLSANARIAFVRGDIRPFLGFGIAGALPLMSTSTGEIGLIHRSFEQEVLSEVRFDEKIGLSRRPSVGPSAITGLTTPRFQFNLNGSAKAYAFDPERLVFGVEIGAVYFFMTR